jgi:SAM-dependent methyltransferase
MPDVSEPVLRSSRHPADQDGTPSPARPAPTPVPTPQPAARNDPPPTADKEYADRLNRLQGKRWKKILNVQLPWKLHLKVLKPGRTLDVGCGNGRNLGYLPAGSVGVDHNPYSVATARANGGEAYTDGEFFDDPVLTRPGGFDTILAAHLVEHLSPAEARAVLGSYLPMVRPGGKIVFFTPQERGYASDPTHVAFTGFDELSSLCADLGVQVERRYSFPFPRWTGKLFIYNEFVLVARVPAG